MGTPAKRTPTKGAPAQGILAKGTPAGSARGDRYANASLAGGKVQPFTAGSGKRLRDSGRVCPLKACQQWARPAAGLDRGP